MVILIGLVIFLFITNSLTFALMLESHKGYRQLKESKPTVQVKELPSTKTICECDHPSSLHDDTGCKQVLFKTVDGITTSKSFICKCIRYTGPQPLPQFFAPPMLGESQDVGREPGEWS